MPNQELIVEPGTQAYSETIPYKAVLILGENLYIPDALRRIFQQEGYRLIGDGRTNLHLLDLQELQNRISRTTRIYISVHGLAKGKIHSIDGKPTKDFFTYLLNITGNMPLSIQLDACYSGAAALDVGVFPEGSVLVAHGTADAAASISIGNKILQESSMDVSSNTDLVYDFLNRFALNVKQAATISIKTKDGIFKHPISPPDVALTHPDQILKYLNWERSNFIKEYNKDPRFALKMIDPAMLTPITLEDAKKWRGDNFLYAVSISNAKLLKALQTRIADFDEFINHSVEGRTALNIAALEGDHIIVSALLASDKIQPELENQSGHTALTVADQYKRDSVIYAIITSGKVDLMESKNYDIVRRWASRQGVNTLRRAAKEGHDYIVSIILALSEIDAVALNMRDISGKTVLEWAVYHNKLPLVKELLSRRASTEGIDFSNANHEIKTLLMKHSPDQARAVTPPPLSTALQAAPPSTPPSTPTLGVLPAAPQPPTTPQPALRRAPPRLSQFPDNLEPLKRHDGAGKDTTPQPESPAKVLSAAPPPYPAPPAPPRRRYLEILSAKQDGAGEDTTPQPGAPAKVLSAAPPPPPLTPQPPTAPQPAALQPRHRHLATLLTQQDGAEKDKPRGR